MVSDDPHEGGMVVCERCGGELPPDARFCGYCGIAQAQAPTLPPPPPEWRAVLRDGEDDGGTLTFSGLVTNRWQAVLPNGTLVRIEGPLLIGRRPDPARGPPGARLVTVEDPKRTASRSHLVLAPSTGGVLATDVSGRTGIVVTGAGGTERQVTNASIELTAPSRIALGAVSIWVQPD